MIRRLKYNEINFEKYKNCLENSCQYKYSADVQFLDVITKKSWELLVYDDYEAVMPVPLTKKMGLKFVTYPILCQQLGVFSKADSAEVNELFLQFLLKNFNIHFYTFNDANALKTKLETKKNYLIYPDSYENVRNRYSPKRKRKIRTDEYLEDHSKIENVNFETAIPFINQHLIGLKNKMQHAQLQMIYREFYESGRMEFSAFFLDGKIIGLLAIYSDEKTVALLGTFSDREFLKFSASSRLIDHVISQNIETKIFDFEGSELPNVEEFFRGFRPELKPYPYIAQSKKEILKKMLK